MADDAGEKRALRDKAAHENVTSEDLYSVKSGKEETKLRGSKYVMMSQWLHDTHDTSSVHPHQGPVDPMCMPMKLELDSNRKCILDRTVGVVLLCSPQAS